MVGRGAALDERWDAPHRQHGGEGRQRQQEEQPAAPGGPGAPGGDTHGGAPLQNARRAALEGLELPPHQEQGDGEQHQHGQEDRPRAPAGVVQVHRAAFGQTAGRAQLGQPVRADGEEHCGEQRQGQHHQDPGEPTRSSAVHPPSLGHASVPPLWFEEAGA